MFYFSTSRQFRPESRIQAKLTQEIVLFAWSHRMYTQVYCNKYLLTSHIPIDIHSYHIIRKQEDANNNNAQRLDNNATSETQTARDRQIRAWGTVTTYNNDLKYVHEQVMQKCNTVLAKSLREYKEKHMNKKGNGNAGVVLGRKSFFHIFKREDIQNRDIGANVQTTQQVTADSNGKNKKLGSPGGPEIDNKHTILKEVDDALGVKKPPDVEFIFVEPYPYA
jgi:hypothetical protein